MCRVDLRMRHSHRFDRVARALSRLGAEQLANVTAYYCLIIASRWLSIRNSASFAARPRQPGRNKSCLHENIWRQSRQFV